MSKLEFFAAFTPEKNAFLCFQENVKVPITHNRDYTYSDVVVTNDPRDLEGNDEYFVHHPCVIFEVVSKNSRLDDTVDKFIRYKNIESLRNYVLVDSEKSTSRCVPNWRAANGNLILTCLPMSNFPSLFLVLK